MAGAMDYKDSDMDLGKRVKGSHCERGTSEAIPFKAATDVRDSSFRCASFRMTAHNMSIVGAEPWLAPRIIKIVT